MTTSSPSQVARIAPGFTLIEVLVSGVLCGLMAFVLMAILRASEELALKGRSEAAVASILAGRGALLLGVPYSSIRNLNGSFTLGNGAGTSSLWMRFPVEDNSVENFVTWGEPLPGETGARGLTRVVETITFSPVSGNAGWTGIRIEYLIVWTLYPGGTESRLQFNFVRYDNKLF